MGYPHANVLHLDEVALQGVVEAILEQDELGDLDRPQLPFRKIIALTHLRVLLVTEGSNDELCSLYNPLSGRQQLRRNPD